MKIAIFTDFFYPELSGVADSVLNLSNSLAKLGHTIMIIAPSYSAKNFNQIGLEKGEIVLGPNIIIKRMPSIGVPNSPTGQNRLPISCFKGLYLMHKFKPDIIHTNSPLLPGLEALLSSKILNIPLIGTNHTAMEEFAPGPKWFVNLFCTYCSWLYNKCDFVSTPSQFLINNMIKYGFNNKNVKPISNPINIENFSPENSIEKEKIKKDFGFSKNTILYTGRLSKEKNVDDIIRAISLVSKEISDISFVIAGHGKDKEKLEILAKELNILDKVQFLGSVIDKIKYSKVFKASDIFVLMSTSETQGMGMILAMASGLPVVAANSTALPEYVNQNNGFLVEPHDYIDLASKILILIKDKGLAKNKGENGIKLASTLSSDSIAKKWETIYSEYIKK